MPRKQLPLQIYSSTPITPRAEQSEPMEQDVEYSGDTESDEESLSSHGSQQQIVDRGQFVQWSRSGPSNVSGSPVSGTLRSEHSEGCYKEPLHVSEDCLQSYQDQHICKPRKLSYEDKPYNQEKPEEGMSDEEVIRREVQGLINLAGSKTLQAVRRKHRMIRSFFQRTSDMMLSSIDTFRDETQTISYGALEKYKRQFSEQVQGLRKQMEKTTLIVDGLEKQFKILKSQRQVEEKRFKSLQHLQSLMETEVTKLEQRRNEQEATLRTEMEKEMLKLQKKFLQESRKQTEDHVKLAFNTLLFP